MRKGQKHSEETRAKMRESHLGKQLSAAHRASMSKAQKGRVMSETHRAALARTKYGAQNPMWKGDDAGAHAVHARIVRRLGKASAYICARCPAQARDWSFDEPSGHSPDFEQYEPLCRSCHVRKDRNLD